MINLDHKAEFHRSPDLPGAGQKTLPGRCYTSTEVFAAEHARIFGGCWLIAGRADQIPEPGDYFVRSIGAESIIFVRGRDGTVRGFHNVCRHRGARICSETAGKFTNALRCPYHSWAYAFDGKLVAAPFMDPEFDADAYPLRAVSVELWEGFVFFCLSADPEPFEQTHGTIIGRFRRYHLPELRSAGRIAYEVQANWKLMFENYSECYHCTAVHPALVRLSPADSGANDLIEGAFLGGYMEMKHENGSMSQSGGVCGLPLYGLPPEDLHRVYYYSLFPNALLSLHPDYAMVHTLWPQSTNATHIECDWLFHPDSIMRAGFNPQDAIQFWDMTNREDWHVCEISQLGVSSSAYTPGPYSTREAMSAAFDREYLRIMELEL